MLKKTSKSFCPKVSIVIPVYNGEKYMREAIDSALRQTYKNIEIIVVNDGSIDGTDEIAKSYGNKIRYFKKQNGGVASALNFAIKIMTGDYFSWLSHDDVYKKEKIERQIKLLRKNEEKDTIVACLYDVVDENCNYLYSFEDKQNEIKNNRHPLFYLFNGYINGCALLINKSVFNEIGVFDENLPTTQDYDLWFRIFRKKKIIFSNFFDLLSRCHDLQGSKNNLEAHIKECDALWIKMINTLSEREIKLIYHNVINGYCSLLLFLEKNTLYVDIKKNLKKKIVDYYFKNSNKVKGISLLKEVIFNIYCDDKSELLKLVLARKKTKRIVFALFGRLNDRGGLNRAVINIANALVDKYEIYFLTSKPIENSYQVDKRINIITGDFYPNIKAVLDMLIFLRIDLYVNVYNCVQWCLEFLPEIKKLDVKVVAWNHECYFLPYNNMSYTKSVLKRNEIFKQIDLVIWLTYTSQYIYSMFCNNCVTLANALPIKRNNKYLKNKNKNIICVGRFDDPQKNLEGLIIMLSELVKIDASYKLIVVGSYNLNMKTSDNTKTISDLLNDFSLTSDNIIFKGHVDDVSLEYEKASLNIVVSHHEGFGLSIIESASFGIPTIAFNDSGFSDIIENEKTGFLIDRNYAKMAKKIKEIMEDNKSYFKLRYSSYKMSENYDRDIIIKKWEAIIELLFKKNRKNEAIYKELEKKYKIELSNDEKNEVLVNSFCEYEEIIGKILEKKDLDLNCELDNCSQDENTFSKVMQKNEILINDNENLKKELEIIRKSFSIKITKPLRAIKKIINRFIIRSK